jgi:hypothetical protein
MYVRPQTTMRPHTVLEGLQLDAMGRYKQQVSLSR